MFCASSEEALLIFFEAGLFDKELLSECREDMPLIHYCIATGILTKEILRRLDFQKKRVEGTPAH